MPAITSYRSSNARMVQKVLPTALFALLVGFTQWARMQHEGISLLASTIVIAALGAVALIRPVINNAVIVTLSDTVLSVRHGFRLFGTKPQSIPLKHIHTIQMTEIGRKSAEKLRTGQLTLIYRHPAKKMVHATTTFSIASIPDGPELLMELAKRTGATIKLHTGGMADKIITAEELQRLLEWHRD